MHGHTRSSSELGHVRAMATRVGSLNRPTPVLKAYISGASVMHQVGVDMGARRCDALEGGRGELGMRVTVPCASRPVRTRAAIRDGEAGAPRREPMIAWSIIPAAVRIQRYRAGALAARSSLRGPGKVRACANDLAAGSGLREAMDLARKRASVQADERRTPCTCHRIPKPSRGAS